MDCAESSRSLDFNISAAIHHHHHQNAKAVRSCSLSPSRDDGLPNPISSHVRRRSTTVTRVKGRMIHSTHSCAPKVTKECHSLRRQRQHDIDNPTSQVLMETCSSGWSPSSEKTTHSCAHRNTNRTMTFSAIIQDFTEDVGMTQTIHDFVKLG